MYSSKDLGDAIVIGREASKLCPPGHPDRPSYLHKLSRCLLELCLKEHTSLHLKEAIILCQEALEHCPPDHPDRSYALHTLAQCLREQFWTKDRTRYLKDVITLGREAFDIRPLGHPDRTSTLHSLAVYLANRFDKNGRMSDLEAAITLCLAALEGRPLGHPDRHQSLHNFASCIHTRYRKVRMTTDLDGAIVLSRAALDLRPPGHPDRPSSLHSLAVYLADRFDKTDQLGNLQEAITVGRSAFDLYTPDHPNWHLSVKSLLTFLRKRYQRDRAVADLEEMITLGRAMLERLPQEHPEWSSSITSFENDITEMIDKPRTEVDLDKAIILGREIIAIRILGNPYRSQSLRKLISCLEERFQMQDAISDLDELIMLHRNVLELHPPGNPARSSLLHDLARCLWHRFQRNGEAPTLEEAITFERAALELRQWGHTNHAESLQTLVHFLGEYSKLGKTDIRELTALGRAIMKLGPSEYPDYVSSLRVLANQVVTVDVQEAITLTDSALKVCPMQHPDRPALRKTFAICCQRNLKIGSKADRDGVKKLIRDAVYDTLENLPTRLLNTLTGRLCGRDELISDFDNSARYKELLASAANSHPLLHGCVRETVSAYFKYATLSHRWGSDEPLLRDIQGQVIYEMEPTHGIMKLYAFCADACERGYLWAWSDTCCIDKESSAELQEAIGCMFRWYRRSALTIVHLADVSEDSALCNSVWFERGWTLQELLAPHAMLFFKQDWSLYGDQMSTNHKEDHRVLAELEKVTNIAPHYLTDFHPGMDDARSRLRWASTRRTTRPEDMAYSLFGVFNLHLPVLYGEPKENALGRLLAEIISQSGDISVLDWVGEASPFHSCFPAHIAVYRTLPFPSSHAEIQSSMPNVHELEPSSQSLDALFASLSKLDPPHFVGRRLKLPCIVHRVTAIHSKQWEPSTPSHVYDIHAEGLTSLEIVLANEFENNSLTTFPYVLIRPWHPKLLHSSTVVDTTVSDQLTVTLGQPFHALLLEELPQNEYRRIASSSVIIARATSAASILCSNVQTLNIV